MKKLFAAVIAALFGALMFTGASAQSGIYGVDLSPDGRTYAVLKQYGDQRVVAFYSTDNPSAQPTAVGLGDIKTGSFAWGGDNYALVQAFGEQGGIDLTTGLATLKVSRWLSIERDSGKVETLFDSNELGNDYYYIDTSAGALISTLPNDPNRALFARGDLKNVSWQSISPAKTR